jgi:transcriptional regulator with XRE-family HTH domain
MFLEVSCTITGMEQNDWERLGQAIVARRTQLGMRTREALAAASGLSSRLLSDVEKGRRSSYGSSTLLDIERALRWAPGTVEAHLKGRRPPPNAEDSYVVRKPDGPTGNPISDTSMLRLLNTGQRAAQAAGEAEQRGVDEPELIDAARRTFEYISLAAVEHFGGIKTMVELGAALREAEYVAQEQLREMTEGERHEGTGETTQESVPEDAREDGGPGTSKTRAADGGDTDNVHALNRRKQGSTPAPDFSNPEGLPAAARTEPGYKKSGTRHRDDEGK